MKNFKKSKILIFFAVIIILTCFVIIFKAVYMKVKELKVINAKDTSNMYYKNPVGVIKDIGDPFVLKASNGSTTATRHQVEKGLERGYPRIW